MYVCAVWYRICLFLLLFYWILELFRQCLVFYSFYSNWNSNSYSNLTFKSIDIPVLSNQNQIILGAQTNVQMWKITFVNALIYRHHEHTMYVDRGERTAHRSGEPELNTGV
jgi:hypothetical protein